MLVLLIGGLSGPGTVAQGNDIDVLTGSNLADGFDMGANSSAGRTGWLSRDTGMNALKMAYPKGQTWGAVFITFGHPVDPPRPFIDLSGYDTMAIEMRSQQGGDSVDIGIKSNTHPDDGSEEKVTLNLSSQWNTYEIPLKSFAGVDLSRVYVVAEFVFSGAYPEIIYVRRVKYLHARSASPDLTSKIQERITSKGGGFSFIAAPGWNNFDPRSLGDTLPSYQRFLLTVTTDPETDLILTGPGSALTGVPTIAVTHTPVGKKGGIPRGVTLEQYVRDMNSFEAEAGPWTEFRTEPATQTAVDGHPAVAWSVTKSYQGITLKKFEVALFVRSQLYSFVLQARAEEFTPASDDLKTMLSTVRFK
jgi:hypothetical protein